jgi:hypothetical protein
MTPQKLREKLNDQYTHDFMKEVGTWLRRMNIRNAIFSKAEMKGEINFSKFSLRLTYTSYHYILKFNDTGLIMSLLDNKGKTLGHYQDFNKLKAAIIKHIKESEAAKKPREF